MTFTTLGYVLIFAFVLAALTIGGWLLVGICMHGMRKSDEATRGLSLRSSLKLRDLWVGSTERIATFILVYFTPAYVPAFIGGWIALKFAAHWQRQGTGASATIGSLFFLVGSVISFALAIGIGLIFNFDGAMRAWISKP